jgi:hypothetical protein
LLDTAQVVRARAIAEISNQGQLSLTVNRACWIFMLHALATIRNGCAVIQDVYIPGVVT